MSLRSCLAAFLLSASFAVSAQTAPAHFRLILPQGPGSIAVDITGDWKLARAVVYDKGARPSVLLENDRSGLNASYMIEHYAPGYNTPEECLNDTLNGVMHGALSKAKVENLKIEKRTAKDGQPLAVASYLVAKNQGMNLDQENVFATTTHDHTCATVHLSKVKFTNRDQSLFDAMLDSFHFEPTYLPTPDDRSVMARLLPPGMAALYDPKTTLAADAGPRSQPDQPADQSLSFALPDHPGFLHMDAPNFSITELSAKPNGREFGIRAEDNTVSHAMLLAFLFVTDETMTAASCRDRMINEEAKDKSVKAKLLEKGMLKSDSGVEIAFADLVNDQAPKSSRYLRRAFVASGDLCADIATFSMNKTMVDSADQALKTLVFHPTQPADFFSTLRYGYVLAKHEQNAAAGRVYEKAITLAAQTKDPLKWQRIATDDASMAYGIAGDLSKSRALNNAAIARDPDYPLYYYNLACADAESGDAAAARTHLEQAYARKSHILEGEHLPDATQDDSILKLKGNKQFWAFVQTLPKP